MAQLRIAEQFRSDLLQVQTKKLLNKILDSVDLLQHVPTMGSRNVPQSIKRDFGDDVRKVPVNPFDIVITYDEEADIVEVIGLVHQKAAW